MPVDWRIEIRVLRGKIEEIFDDNEETYGYRRVHAELVRQGEQATSELVRRLMRDLGLVPNGLALGFDVIM